MKGACSPYVSDGRMCNLSAKQTSIKGATWGMTIAVVFVSRTRSCLNRTGATGITDVQYIRYMAYEHTTQLQDLAVKG